MKLIVGLGNPGRQYEQTRHNIGFHAIDVLADRWNAPLNQTKFNGMYATVHRPEGKALLVKPLTYMNLSGECVRPMMDYFEVPEEDLIVIYDDLDLPPGKLRLRQKGSPGGHNGMKSIIQHIGTRDFDRIRIGIGRPDVPMAVTDWVLGRFTDEEAPDMREAAERAADACEAALRHPFIDVMNEFNAK
ncbi:Peptidyl-tRNA hydrolase [Bhargavaea cecembensis DSE10]|uniref:Peptidyl-tRNA hydrolase n=1 Tax=Bhargavaea cecembensis DSE10 TaxID=1235279 RepID=M7NTP1_9BACL|nr:aminoacyl-tRNA hydrolase [Bhargavaea cecembensis]EMR05055.1 Peptidyl-tRNA hydrolase [Bhargavaea cecembensis DSE10]